MLNITASKYSRLFLSAAIALIGGVASGSAAAQSNWQQTLNAFVVQQLPATTTAHTIKVLTPAAALADLDACTQVTAQFNRPPQRLAGRMMVRLHCASTGADHYVQIDVSATGKYLVAAHELSAQHLLTRSDVVTTTGDLQDLPRHALLATPENIGRVQGSQLRRGLNAGAVLQDNLLAKPTLVNYGDTLVIEVHGEGFQINRTGDAMDSGAIGDIIRVRLNNRQLLRVEIVAAGRAKPVQ
ncbi:flagellar basal body P-ring formation chaperone FlgA [Pseudidiomarina gelatinasegens]|uniref:flagellar basal body P-ring formation chaperone FlgA n=1 Tax=Pseudidiomarina gelatinasegens TaxID=2487740 RepID=UPI0030ED0CB0